MISLGLLTHLRRFALALAALAAPILALAAAAPYIHVGGPAAALLTFAVASASIVASCAIAPAETVRRALPAASVVFFGLCASGLAFTLGPVGSGLSGSIGVIACAWVLGTIVGAQVAHPGHLLPVAALSSAVDLWSVTSPSGPTHHIVRNKVLVRLLTVSAAVAPSRDPEPAIGFGDVVFVALYLSAASSFKLSRPRTLLALSTGLFGAGVVAISLGASIPALPLIGAMVVMAHPEARRVPREDRPMATFALIALLFSVVRAIPR